MGGEERERDPRDAFASIQYLLYHSQPVFWCHKYADHVCLVKSPGHYKADGCIKRGARGSLRCTWPGSGGGGGFAQVFGVCCGKQKPTLPVPWSCRAKPLTQMERVREK